MVTFAGECTSYASANNVTWPFFVHPHFEYHATKALEHGGFEAMALGVLVSANQRDPWEEYSVAHVQEWVEAGHYYRYGNLDQLQGSLEGSFIKQIHLSNGTTREPVNDFYAPFWQYSPPALSYAAFNWDFRTSPEQNAAIEAMLRLRNETTVSAVSPYQVVVNEHDALHSTDELNTSSSDFPHSFFFYPIYRDIKPTNDTPIVGFVATANAWDLSMRKLIPNGIPAISVILSNTCGQRYRFWVEGQEAYFRRNGDQLDPKFLSLGQRRNISFSERDDSSNCRFSLVRIHCNILDAWSFLSNIYPLYE